MMIVHDHAIILEKYSVEYYCCCNCGFIQTEEPYWLNEAYSKAISAMDTGIMLRNLSNANELLFFLRYIRNNKCLDFGGGHGILTRIMRDYGFNFFHHDKYAENLFANGFEGDLTDKYDLITAFENFEHFVKPMEEIEKIINQTEVLFFSTNIIPKNNPLIKDWWYFAPGGGQHISFYTKKSIEYIADKFNLYLVTNNISTHILSKKPLNKKIFTQLKIYNKLCKIINMQKIFKKTSKTMSDMYRIIEKSKL